jgi:hypothetical protein
MCKDNNRMVRMSWTEVGFVTMNSSLLAMFYTLLGVFVSYVLYHLFDSYDEVWIEQRSTLFKITDVSLEISILAVIAFWSAHIIQGAAPFFPVRRELDTLVDGYISGIFYIFAIFMFMDELTEKLKHLFHELFNAPFSKYFPQHGSIVDLSLSYTPLPKKTDATKPTLVRGTDGVQPYY